MTELPNKSNYTRKSLTTHKATVTNIENQIMKVLISLHQNSVLHLVSKLTFSPIFVSEF